MKIKYKDVVGNLILEEYCDSCTHCCFRHHRDCVPPSVWRCSGTIFEKSESQVFEV